MNTVVCLGDSITYSVREAANLELSYTWMLERRLREAGIDAEMVNAGISGNTAQDGLARLEQDVLAHKPDVVTVMFGTNDQNHPVGEARARVDIDSYERALREIVRLVRLAGGEVVLVTPPPLGEAWGKVSEIPAFYASFGASVIVGQYADRVRTLARELNTPLADVYRAFINAVIAGADIGKILPDGVHPYGEGHEIMATEMVGVVASVLKARG